MFQNFVNDHFSAQKTVLKKSVENSTLVNYEKQVLRCCEVLDTTLIMVSIAYYECCKP